MQTNTLLDVKSPSIVKLVYYVSFQ